MGTFERGSPPGAGHHFGMEFSMVSESQKRATAKYQREKSKAVTIRFFPSDMDLYEHLKSQPNQAGYVKELIRRDMEK